ncbi:hypothetical protein Cadr_000008358 [Camelus dromedarius]|uniref:Uncharacterized protein n=1 Tax=Camelus dromedarius TaxID=9838 RepID=A0A5N4DYX8_CAMDR|nr:hypothetical protein Cadr_000008358 [Camelus dromedarius]
MGTKVEIWLRIQAGPGDGWPFWRSFSRWVAEPQLGYKTRPRFQRRGLARTR